MKHFYDTEMPALDQLLKNNPKKTQPILHNRRSSKQPSQPMRPSPPKISSIEMGKEEIWMREKRQL